MKVVLFCGGLGMRMREHSDTVPKPMVPIGYRPVLWHLMRYYAHYGHRDFVLCLGYQAQIIKSYFLEYQETLSNDFILEDGGKKVTLLASDVDEWRITFVDTGMHANIGQRLAAVRHHLEDEPAFLANYADVVSDAPLPELIDQFERQDAVALSMAVRPSYTFHMMEPDAEGRVTEIRDVRRADLWINGGFFVLRADIFDYMRPGEELVVEPFQRLIEIGKLSAYRHTGFWAPMDSLKERQVLDDMYQSGNRPWYVWNENAI